MIRPATYSDIPRILELGVIMHATTDYSTLNYDQERAGQFMYSLIAGAGVVFLAEVDGVVVGGIAGALGQQWFNDDLYAYEIALFIDPASRSGITAVKLVKAFMAWAKLRGAKHVEAGITTGRGVDGISQFYQSLGFKSEHPMFKMEI
jgi:GNAT superfamily N-acetyltransferase